MADWWTPGDFTLGANTQVSLPDLPSLNFGGGGGGGSSFWPTTATGWLGAGLDLAKFGVGTALGVQNQQAMAKYQRDLSAYNKQRADQEAQYNKQVQDYLKARQEWEGKLAGAWEESQSQFMGSLGDFQTRISGILESEIGQAMPLLAQSQELLEPAVAALAKGEVPPLWEPVINAAKQRAYAAAMQQYANTGQDASTASAAIQDQIDQQAHQMVLAAAQQMLQGGLSESGQALQYLSGAGNAAIASLDPVMREFLGMQQVLASILGGFPSLAAPMGAPAAPVA